MTETNTQLLQKTQKRVVYVEAQESHSVRHEIARRVLGYSAGQAGFFKHALSRACRTKFISFDEYLQSSHQYNDESDALIFSSKSGIRKLEADTLKSLLSPVSKPICVLVHEARPSFMIEDRIADFCSVIFKREPFRDLERYELSNHNRQKIAPTILANPLSPLFNRLPWLELGKRPSHFGYETEKEHDAFFIGRVGKNRYQNRIDAWARLADDDMVRSIGGLMPAEAGFDVPERYLTTPLNSKDYRRTVLKSRVNLALDGIGPFTFRHLELFWCGAFCLSETDLEQIWLREPIVTDRDYVFFETLDDMIEKVRFYAKDDSARDQIAKNGRAFYERLYSVKQHAREIQAALFSET